MVVQWDLALFQGFVPNGKLGVYAAKRSLYLKVNKAGKVVVFVLSGQCQPTLSLNSDRQFLTGGMRIINVKWSGL